MKKFLYLLIFFGLLSIVWAETPWKYGQCIKNSDTSSYVKATDTITNSGNYVLSDYLFDSSKSGQLVCESPLEDAYYRINYDSGYGQHTVIQSGDLDYGVPYTLPKDVFTRTGYTLGYWCDSLDCGTGRPYTTITGNCGSQGCEIYLYAQWSAISYDITYNLNGGNLSGEKRSYTVETDYTLPTPTRTGYTFDGWYTTSGLTGTAVTKIAKGSTGDKTFYAKWKQSIPNKGDIIKLTNTLDMNKNGVVDTFRVLEVNGTQAKVMSMENVGSSVYGGILISFGRQNSQGYKDSTLDKKMTAYYDSLPADIKSAIVPQTINQSMYKTAIPLTASKKLAQVTVGTRYVYALGVDDIIAYLGEGYTYNDLMKMFFNVDAPKVGNRFVWLRSVAYDYNLYAYIVSGQVGYACLLRANSYAEVHPAFVIDLSRLS